MKLSNYLFFIPIVLGSSTHLNSKYLQKRSDGKLELTPEFSKDKGAFVVSLGFGSEKDEIEVIVDTGSSDLWVPSSNVTCDTETSNSAISCPKNGFDWEKSSTFNKSSELFQLKYGDGDISEGFFASDTVWIGDTPVHNTTFGVANETDSNPVLGIGSSKLESGYQDLNESIYPNFPEKLKENEIIDTILYSILLNKESTSSLLFGAVDHEKYLDDLVTLSVLKNNEIETARLAVSLDSIDLQVGDKKYSLISSTSSVVFDTGSTYSTFSAKVLKEITDHLDGEVDDDYYLVNEELAKKSNLTIKFKDLEIEAAIQYESDNDNQEVLLYNILSDDAAIDVILGQDVLTQMYLVFDLENEEISVGKQSGSSKSDIEVVGADGEFSKSSSNSTETSSSASSIMNVSSGLLLLSLLFTI